MRAPKRDQTRQALCAAASRQPSEAHLAEAELRVLGRDADVAGERLFEPAAVGVAIDRGDDRLRQLEHRSVGGARVFAPGSFDVVRLDIAAGAERAVAGAGEDCHAEITVGLELRPDFREAAVGLEVARVQALGPIDRDIGDGAFLFEDYFHLLFDSFWISCSRRSRRRILPVTVIGIRR